MQVFAYHPLALAACSLLFSSSFLSIFQPPPHSLTHSLPSLQICHCRCSAGSRWNLPHRPRFRKACQVDCHGGRESHKRGHVVGLRDCNRHRKHSRCDVSRNHYIGGGRDASDCGWIPSHWQLAELRRRRLPRSGWRRARRLCRVQARMRPCSGGCQGCGQGRGIGIYCRLCGRSEEDEG